MVSGYAVHMYKYVCLWMVESMQIRFEEDPHSFHLPSLTSEGLSCNMVDKSISIGKEAHMTQIHWVYGQLSWVILLAEIYIHLLVH